MTKLQAIRWFASQITTEKVTISKKRLENNWAIDLAVQQKTPRLLIPKDFQINDAMDKIFRKNFVERCPMARGFSNATIAILHEFGHWATRSVFDIIAYDKIRSKAVTQEEYMANPYERLATEWAICWLQSIPNRSIAKQFEKYFFGQE